jgi:hypothetical protein
MKKVTSVVDALIATDLGIFGCVEVKVLSGKFDTSEIKSFWDLPFASSRTLNFGIFKSLISLLDTRNIFKGVGELPG